MENSRHFNFVKVTFFDIFFDISISQFLKFVFRGIIILQFLTSRCEILMPGNFDIVCLDIPYHYLFMQLLFCIFQGRNSFFRKFVSVLRTSSTPETKNEKPIYRSREGAQRRRSNTTNGSPNPDVER